MTLNELTREAWADYQAQDFDPDADYPGPDDPDDDPDPGAAAHFTPIVEMGDGTTWGIYTPTDPWATLSPRHACILCALEIDLPDEDGYDLHTYHMRLLGYPHRDPATIDQPGRRVAA